MFFSVLGFFTSLFINLGYAELAREELIEKYEWHCTHPSDIVEHIPVLRNLAREAVSFTEIGLRDMNSTWGILLGLAESGYPAPRYIGIDIEHPPTAIFDTAERLAKDNNIDFKFIQANDMDIDTIEETDVLFIDSMHTYCHLTYELEKFSGKARKFIAMHDTDDPWGFIDDFQQYHGDKSEYPSEIDRNKAGLWQAVVDFLDHHPEWSLYEKRTNNHGFTVLKRVDL